MWTIAASNKKFDGPLGSYNGLTDVHLAHYFSRPFRQGQLKAAKLITNDGLIIPEQKVKMATFEYEKQRKNYDMLASSVIQNALHKKGSWKKKLCNYIEDISKIENVEQIKAGPKKNSRKDAPCRNFKGCSTVPVLTTCNMNRLLQNQDYQKKNSTFKRLAHSACVCFKDGSSLHANSQELKRCFSAKEISPYTTAWLNNSYHGTHSNLKHVKMPRRKKKKSKSIKNKLSQPLNSSFTECTKLTKLSIPDQSFKVNQCKVTLFYHGHTPLNNFPKDFTEEVLIRQQHCGGTSVIVYKGPITPNEALTFISLNHEDFVFSMTLFLDGIRYLKLSSCCIFRYPVGKRLGGTSGNFSIQSTEGGVPCLKCQYRQMEANSKAIKQKLEDPEDSVLLKREIGSLSSNIISKDVAENGGDAVYENYFASEIAESSVESEIGNSPSEEIEENLGVILENHTSNLIENSNDTIDDEQFEVENISVEEDFVESSYESDSTNSIAESVKNVIESEIKQFKVSPYASESSDEETGKSHMILASVHGSPTRGK